LGKVKVNEILAEKNPFQKYLEPVSLIETNIDDVSGEILGNFIKVMENEKILDIQIIQSITKKNRPGYIIKILCHPEFQYKIIEKIFNEIGTLGIRYNVINRICIEREIKKIKISIENNEYDLCYKISFIQIEGKKKIINIKPEYEDLKKISIKTGIPVKNVMARAYYFLNQNYIIESEKSNSINNKEIK